MTIFFRALNLSDGFWREWRLWYKLREFWSECQYKERHLGQHVSRWVPLFAAQAVLIDLQNKLEIISLFRSNDFYVTLFCSLHHFKKHSSASLRTNITFAKYEVMSIWRYELRYEFLAWIVQQLLAGLAQAFKKPPDRKLSRVLNLIYLIVCGQYLQRIT